MISIQRRSAPTRPAMTIPRNTGTIEADAQTVARWLAGHLAYVQYQGRGPAEPLEQRRLFSASCDQVRQSQAVAALLEGAAPRVLIHKMILSPDQDRVEDWRGWTRQVMRRLAARERRSLCWVGVLHQFPTPHVHLVLAGQPVPRARIIPWSERRPTRPLRAESEAR